MNVLVVDDSELLRKRLIEYLKDFPEIKRILQAENSTSAEKIISKEKLDIIIIDIRMPGNNGIELIKNINTQAIKLFLLIILMNNMSMLQKKLGLTIFLKKTDDIDVLGEIVKRVHKKSRIS